MSDHRDYFRDQKKPEHMQRSSARNDARFETAKVNFLINTLGLTTRHRRELEDAYYAAAGVRALKLSVFSAMYPNFPILLGCTRLPGVKLHVDKRATLPAMMNTFRATPFYKAYEAFYETNADSANGRTIGLIFRRKGFPRGLIIHDGGPSDFWLPGKITMVQAGEDSAKTKWITVEAFANVVKSIRQSGWRPD